MTVMMRVMVVLMMVLVMILTMMMVVAVVVVVVRWELHTVAFQLAVLQPKNEKNIYRSNYGK